MAAPVAFLEHEFFPWDGLPYPQLHAQYGVNLIEKGEAEGFEQLISYQQATLDHRKKPIASFFRQEKGCSYAELEAASERFFSHAPLALADYTDEALGVLVRRGENQTQLACASGCKSGLGAFLVGEGGMVNCGPQLQPLGDCSGFGLAGRGTQVAHEENTLSYHCRLASPHSRDTGYPWLSDSGYTGAWVSGRTTLEEEKMSVEGSIEGVRSPSDFIFTLFLRAEACFVAGSHKLNPRSLDRYQGPPQKVVIDGLTVYPEGGFKSMEVVPLAGDESYWGAHFLIALTLEDNAFYTHIGRS